MARSGVPTEQARPEDEQDHRVNPAREAQVGDEEDYHFFYNPFKKAIVVNE